MSGPRSRDGRAAPASPVETRRLQELDRETLYGILRLRTAVFVVEQSCVFQDMDGRDLEPATLHLYIEQDGAVVSYLRVLENGEGRHIGRVVTALSARGQGLSGRLMRHALDLCGGRHIDIHAQAYLESWYGGFGFVRLAEPYLEDGILHVDMERPARHPSTRS